MYRKWIVWCLLWGQNAGQQHWIMKGPFSRLKWECSCEATTLQDVTTLRMRMLESSGIETIVKKIRNSIFEWFWHENSEATSVRLQEQHCNWFLKEDARLKDQRYGGSTGLGKIHAQHAGVNPGDSYGWSIRKRACTTATSVPTNWNTYISRKKRQKESCKSEKKSIF